VSARRTAASPAVPKAPDGRERIITAAERLIAERGIDVPLRDIAVAADQRNNSAVQYHFGSRDGLIEAVIADRTPAVERRRLERLTRLEVEGVADDPRALVATLVEPLLEARALDGVTHHARFLEQVRTHPTLADPASLEVEGRATVRLVTARLGRSLGALAKDERAWRLQAMASAMFALLADHERALDAGSMSARQERLAQRRIVDALTAILVAPPGA